MPNLKRILDVAGDVFYAVVKWGYIIIMAGCLIAGLYFGFKEGFPENNDDGDPKYEWERYLY